MSEQYFKRALDMFETHLGSDDPQVANTSENIAELYMKTNRESLAKVYQRRALEIRSKSLSENLIGIEKSEPTLDMRVVTLSPAKEGSPWNHRVASMRTECQMRCGKKSVCFCLITRPVCSEADHGEIYDPSRTQFSTDYVRVANGKRFPRVLLQAVRHTPISRNGCNWASSQGFGKSPSSYTTIWWVSIGVGRASTAR